VQPELLLLLVRAMLLLVRGPMVPGTVLTSIPFRHCDVKVVTEGRRLHDAVCDLVVWRGVLVRRLGHEQRE